MKINGLPPDVKKELVRCLDIYNNDGIPLLIGETGVGKSFLATEIHRASKWRNGRLVRVDLSSLESELFESELFGYEDGAFTGARRKGKKGLLDLAQNGTLFFDEIGNLEFRYQKKFLIFLEERKFRRLGGTRWIKLDSGLIFATNKNLEEMVKKGNFRKDLYFRLSTCSIWIPPLRERMEYFDEILKNIIKNLKLNSIRFTPAAKRYLKAYSWPGNIRELQNYLIYWSSEGVKTVDVENLPAKITDQSPDFDYKKAVYSFKKEFITKVLKISGWNINEAAKRMRLSRQHLYRLIKELNIKLHKEID